MAPVTPLLRPFRFFSDPPGWSRSPAVTLGLVLASTAALTAMVYGLGFVVAGELSGTVTVDNPAYPGDAFCDDSSFGGSAFDEELRGCEEPATIERDVSTMVMDAFDEVAAMMLFLFPLLWLLGGAVLHAAVWLARGDGTVGDTYWIAAWSGVASALLAIPGFLLVAAAVRSADLDQADPDAIVASLEASVAGLEPILFGVSLLGATWQAVLWFAGLVGVHDLDEGRALAVAGVLWLFLLVGGL